MPMDQGDTTVQPGTAARTLYDALNSAFGSVTGDGDVFRRQMCVALAAIIPYIQTNGEVDTETGEIS